LYDGQLAAAGSIIYKQRGNKIWPGKNVGQAKDFSLFALKDGIVKYSPYKGFKTKVEVIERKPD
jgi:large subunit ribosomal protein L27